MQISYSMTMRNNHYCVSSEHKCDKSCYIYYILLSSRPLLSAYLPEQDALCDHLFYFSFSPFLFFFRLPPNGRPPVGLRAWGSLTTAMAAIPPTRERMAWHLPELRSGNTFFFLLKCHCRSIHGLKDPHWAPLGRLHASPLNPFRWGLVITGMEVRPGLIHTRCKVLRQRT